MPIGEVIKDRKIVPDQLAFNNVGTSGQGASSYQTTLNEYKTTITNTVTISEATALVRGEVKNRVDSERRAKLFVGDYQALFDYDIDNNIVVTTGTWDPIGFHHAVITTPGCNTIGTVGTSNAAFAFQPTDKDAGVFMVGAHIEFSIPSAANVVWVKLGVVKNGVLYRVIDAMDVGYASDGEGYIVDCILGGAVPVPLAHGDAITVAVYAHGGGSGDLTLTHSSGECEGYVYGHRVLCDRRDVEGTAETGFGYTFT